MVNWLELITEVTKANWPLIWVMPFTWVKSTLGVDCSGVRLMPWPGAVTVGFVPLVMPVTSWTVMVHSLGLGYVTPPFPAGSVAPAKFLATYTYF